MAERFELIAHVNWLNLTILIALLVTMTLLVLRVHLDETGVVAESKEGSE